MVKWTLASSISDAAEQYKAQWKRRRREGESFFWRYNETNANSAAKRLLKLRTHRATANQTATSKSFFLLLLIPNSMQAILASISIFSAPIPLEVVFHFLELDSKEPSRRLQLKWILCVFCVCYSLHELSKEKIPSDMRGSFPQASNLGTFLSISNVNKVQFAATSNLLVRKARMQMIRAWCECRRESHTRSLHGRCRLERLETIHPGQQQ